MENINKLEGNVEEIGDIKRRPIEEILEGSVSASDVLKRDEQLRERVNEGARKIHEGISTRLKRFPHNLVGLISVDSRVLYPPRLELTFKDGYWLGTAGNCVQNVSKFEDLKDDFERRYSKPIKHLTGQYRGFVPSEVAVEPPITDVVHVDHKRESLREVDLVVVPLDAIESYRLTEKYQMGIEEV